MNFLFTTTKEINEYGITHTKHNVLDHFDISIEQYIIENKDQIEELDNFGIGEVEEWKNFKYYNVSYYGGDDCGE